MGARGIGAAIVVTAGLSRTVLADGTSAQEAMVVAARRHGTRILGPNCLGLIVPRIGLNASFAHVTAPTGSVAFVSQSGALPRPCSTGRVPGESVSPVLSHSGTAPTSVSATCSTPLAATRIPGPSCSISNPSRPDAASCRRLVLQRETNRSWRSRLGASQTACARPSRTRAPWPAPTKVHDAALRRAGILRLFSVEEMFEAVETLARVRQPRGERLGIVTNGGGIGVMAVDQLIEDGGHLAVLSPATLDRLNSVLPVTWSHGNPVDLVGDANGARYAEAMRILVRAPGSGRLAGHACANRSRGQHRGCAGRGGCCAGRQFTGTHQLGWWRSRGSCPFAVRAGGSPTFDTPEAAIRAFLQLIQDRRNQQTLMETPPSVPTQFTVSSTAARAVVNEALARITDPAAGTNLDERQSKAILAAYGIPTVDTHIALTPSEAALKARAIGFPVALKILAEGVTHKSDVGGVDLFLDFESTVEHAAERMLGVVAARAPQARVLGFTVQPMVTRTGAHELILGIATDPVFGPVILLAEGGTAVEAIADRSIELPPLNLNLARDLVSRTRVARLLRGARGHVPIDMHALGLALMQVAQMAVDIPNIVEMDINPLLASDKGVLALDARIRIIAATGDVAARLSIRPYPRELEEPFTLTSGRPVLLRPIRPEDEPEHYAFISKLTPSDVRFRFFDTVRDVPHSEMARFTQIDDDREMAFIATAERDGGNETLGVVRVMTDPDNHRAEFAVVVRSDLSGQGLGHR